MMINSLKKVWGAALVLFVCMMIGLYTANVRLLENIRGNLIFTTSENIKNIKKINIERSSEKLTLYEDNNIWRVAEADNYYASFSKIQGLLNAITNAKLGNILEVDIPKDLSWTTIKIFDKDDRKLGEAMISNALDLSEHYIKYPKDDKIYISTWKMQLPEGVASWVPQYEGLIDGVDVSYVAKQDIAISRDTRGGLFFYDGSKNRYHRFEHMKLFDALANLQYNEVLSAQKFDVSQYPHVEKIRLITFEGLISDMEIYTNYKEYWLKIDISTTRLPSYRIEEYVEKNSFLFKDWWFKLPNDIGKILFMLKL